MKTLPHTIAHAWENIEAQARAADVARADLRAVTEELQAQLDAIRQGALDMMRAAIKDFRNQSSVLATLVESNPAMFEKPKSRTLHGWHIGFRKKPGRICVPDEAQTLDLIRTHLPELAQVLIVQHEAVAKAPLNQLTPDQLKLIAVEVVDDSEQAFCKSVGDDVETLLNTVLGRDLVAAIQP